MILKFRESTISRLDRLRMREKEGSEGLEDEKDREIVRACNSIVIFIQINKLRGYVSNSFLMTPKLTPNLS